MRKKSWARLLLLCAPQLVQVGCGLMEEGAERPDAEDGRARASFQAERADTPAPEVAARSDDTFILGVDAAYEDRFGSGNYGHWRLGSLGLPAYEYDHVRDRAAKRSYSGQPPYHMLGNTGTVAHSYADGYHTLFSTRTYPRFTNYFRASRQSFGGGFGYLSDKSTNKIWNTYRPTAPQDYQTLWGMGYARKQVRQDDVEIVEDTFSPVGDDEVLMQKIVVTNRGSSDKELRYYFYWDWEPYIVTSQFPPGGDLLAILDPKTYGKPGPYFEPHRYKVAYDPTRKALRADVVPTSAAPRLAPDAVGPTRNGDNTARTGFFSLLNDTIDAYQVDQGKLFARGATTPALTKIPTLVAVPGAGSPTIAQPSQTQAAAAVELAATAVTFFAEKQLKLGPGESKTFYTLYGMARSDGAVPANASRDANRASSVIDKYAKSYETQLDDVIRDYERKSIRFTFPAGASASSDPQGRTPNDGPWISREVAWDSYYLNAGVMYEDHFKTHTLNQNSVYMAGMGQNMAPRDEVQFSIPLVYSNPSMARETLMHVLRMMDKDGKLPFGSSGYGASTAAELPGLDGRPVLEAGDLGYWLFWGVAEYVFATRHDAFLNDEVWPGQTVYARLKDTFRYYTSFGKGANGLIKLRNSDWSDGLASESQNLAKTREDGESTHTTALALWALPRLKQLADSRNDAALAESIDKFLGTSASGASALRDAMQAQWRTQQAPNGQVLGFYNRARMFGPNDVPQERGGTELWAESNTFALLVEPPLLATDEPSDAQPKRPAFADFVNAIGDVSEAERETASYRGAMTALGLNITAKVAPGKQGVFGDTTWYSLSGAYVRGLANYADSPVARELAWNELKRATLANHADACPELFYGIISGSDSWDTHLNWDYAPVIKPGTKPGLRREDLRRDANGRTVYGSSWLEEAAAAPLLVPGADPEHSINNLHSHSHLLANTLRLVGAQANVEGLVITPAMPKPFGFGWESKTFGVRYEAQRITGKVTPLSSKPFKLSVALTPDLQSAGELQIEVDGAPVEGVRSENAVRFELGGAEGRTLRWSIGR